ncbi:MAG: antibiotic biosynthesis monooxygenase family protein [Dehalococcoidia bacterium]
MFIAMNRFSIAPGREAEFEEGWRRRESRLERFHGFVQFALLKGDTEGEYVSHTTWRSRADFEAWANSEAFKTAHARGLPHGVMQAHPQVSLYEAVLVEGGPAVSGSGK